MRRPNADTEFLFWDLVGFLRPVAKVQVGEKIIRGFEFSQPLFIDLRVTELFVKVGEAEQMVLHAFAGVLGAGAGAQNERPIAGLGEEQLASRLLERARLQ